MPNLKTTLQSGEKPVKTGEILQALGNGIYRVDVGGRIMQLRSSTGYIAAGKHVVIADSGSGIYIVGEEKKRGRKITEFFIEG